jgi:membrane protease YdiL (CAAX protease family)
VNGLQLWLRLTASWSVALVLLVLLHPARPAADWSRPGAILVGLSVGAAIAWLLAGLRTFLSPAAALTLVLTAGAEEVVWRWFALGSLAAVAGPVVALVATSFAFGGVHPGARLQHASTGFAFGAVYLLSGSLAGAWCAHAVYNLLVAAAARRPPPEPA